jgi:HD-like signal output (HDOD) protein
MTAATHQLDEIASRAVALYSRPTVAMELVRLAEEPRVDAKRLKECVAQDPALTCKILRVVNSSLYGLSRPVADLNQAIGLIGIKPLKLLVLGFSLPDALFAEVAARELRWYWTTTLTRAVAARLIAEQIWKQPGDEAFIAGLLQDIGILVLLRELGEPYARFLTGVIDEKCHLAALEQDTLGFDHVQLSAAVLRHWQLPARLVDAIEMPKRTAKLARLESPAGDLPQILQLAEMLMQLVGQGRLQLLSELLEAGKNYRGITKSQLAKLVEGLQAQVDQLGQALSLELTEKRDYAQTLLEAHQHMAALSEQIAGGAQAESADDRLHTELLAHSSELAFAMQLFLARGENSSLQNASVPRGPEIRARKSRDARTVGNDHGSSVASELVGQLLTSAKRCRDSRDELSLVVFEPNGLDGALGQNAARAASRARWAMGIACGELEREQLTIVALSEMRSAAIITNCDRRAAIAVGQSAIDEFARAYAPSLGPQEGASPMLSVGIATASIVPKNFDAARMVERALRCLSAARSCGISAVKSIEV